MSTIPVNPSGSPATPTPSAADKRLAAPAAAASAPAMASAGNLSAVTSTPTLATPRQTTSNNSLPVLVPPNLSDFSDAAITTLLGLLTKDTQSLTLASVVQNMDNYAKQIKDQNELQAANLKEQQQALQKAKNKSWFAKLWGYVTKIATVIAAGAMIAFSGGAATPIAAYMAYTAVAGLVKTIAQDAGWKGLDWLPTSLGDAVGKILVATNAVDKDKAAQIAGWIDVAVAVTMVAYAGASFFLRKGSEAAKEVITNTAKQVNMSTTGTVVNAGATAVSAGGQIGQSVIGLQVADATEVAQTAQADSKKISALLTQAQSLLTSEGEFAQTLQRKNQELNQFVMDLVGAASMNTRNITQNLA